MEALSKFMVDGHRIRPVSQRCLGTHQSGRQGRARVQAFGEMVAVLWAEGNQSGAIRLEELWNSLRETHRFSLFCAYPMSHFGRDAHAEPLVKSVRHTAA